jgi:hypothetical protein
MKIELLYFDDCPGHAELRERLPGLLGQAGVETTIQEQRINSEDAAIAERFLGSPTLRVDGRDVDPSAQQREDYGLRCCPYPSAEGLQRRPPDALITQGAGSDSPPGFDAPA